MKNNITKVYIAAIFFALSGTVYAQEGRVGVNTSNPAATLDVVASPNISTRIDGLIAPRLKGSELKSKDILYTADQDGAIVYVTEAVSGVTDKTTNVTSIGYYYFDKTVGTAGRWMKIANPTAVGAYQEPWNVQSSSTPATTNNQAIYQNGAVSIWRDKVFESTASGSAKVDLHVNGATRIGATDPAVTKKVGASSFAGGNAAVASGNNAMAYGTSVEASGDNSAAFGNTSKAVGTESIAMGNNTTATGAQSFAGGGNGSTATGQYAFAFGNNAQAKANHAVAMGVGTVAPARSSVTLGRYNVNTFTTSDITQNSPGDPIFQVGSGPDDGRRYNIITTFLGTNGTTGVGGGWMAIGGDLNTMPVQLHDETLRVYGGALANKAYVTDINSVTGAATDKLVVADAATGQLKTITASTVVPAITSDNGLTKTGNNVQLGGDLVKATSIGTNGTVTLALTGLQNTGTTSDKIIVSSTNGVLKTIDAATVAPTVTADNGLTKTGNNVQLGGNLVKATSIGTNGTVTLALTGLQNTGSTSDKIIVSSTNGVLKTIDASSLPNATYQEPWNLSGTTTPATANNQAIFQNGAVSIWRNKVFESTASGSAKVDLHVNGATRIGATDPAATKKVGANSFAGGNAAVASGSNAMAYGTSVEASGDSSSAFGNATGAIGSNSIAMGNQSTAVGENSAAFGFKTTSSAINSLSIGANTTAMGAQSVAGGINSTASGENSLAMGNNTKATAFASASFGELSEANSNYSLSAGYYNQTQNPGEAAFGVYNMTTSGALFTVGDGSGNGASNVNRSNIISAQKASNGNFVAIGSGTAAPSKVRDETLRVYGGALSNKNYVTDINSATGASTDKIVVADGTTGQLKTISATGASVSYQEPWNIQNSSTPSASNNDAIYQTGNVAIGRSIGYTSGAKTVRLDVQGEIRTGAGHGGAIGINSVAMGLYNEASGETSFAAGKSNKSIGSGSASFGDTNTNNGDNAFVLGSRNTVNAGSTNSFTGGGSNIMSGNYAFTMGQQNTVSGASAGAFGLGNTSSGERSISIGYYNTASGGNSFAGGNNSTASADSSIAFGNTSKATGRASTALGEFNEANGYSSVALGNSSIANGKFSVATGVGAKTSSIMQTAVGSYNYVLNHSEDVGNNPTSYLFMVGDGYADNSRSNIIVAQTGGGWSNGSNTNNFVAIGSGTNIPSRAGDEKLRVYGGIHANGNIRAGGSFYSSTYQGVYADYVLENYVDGESKINPSYNRMSLQEVEKFIKMNKHLPGVTGINDLQDGANGKKEIDLTNLGVQTLEKAEELYLHVIEQQKQIDELKDLVKIQQDQINQLLKK